MCIHGRVEYKVFGHDVGIISLMIDV